MFSFFNQKKLNLIAYVRFRNIGNTHTVLSVRTEIFGNEALLLFWLIRCSCDGDDDWLFFAVRFEKFRNDSLGSERMKLIYFCFSQHI